MKQELTVNCKPELTFESFTKNVLRQNKVVLIKSASLQAVTGVVVNGQRGFEYDLGYATSPH